MSEDHWENYNDFFNPKLTKPEDLLQQKKNELLQRNKQQKIQKKIEKRKQKIKSKKVKLSEQDRQSLFLVLREYNDELIPQIKKCRAQLEIARRKKDMDSFGYWNDELIKLENAYEMFQQQAIEIKSEANMSNDNIIDLHSMTKEEAETALINKVNQKVSYLKSNKL